MYVFYVDSLPTSRYEIVFIVIIAFIIMDLWNFRRDLPLGYYSRGTLPALINVFAETGLDKAWHRALTSAVVVFVSVRAYFFLFVRCRRFSSNIAPRLRGASQTMIVYSALFENVWRILSEDISQICIPKN